MFFTGIGVLFCVKGRRVEKHLQVELLKEEEKERTEAIMVCDFLCGESKESYVG